MRGENRTCESLIRTFPITVVPAVSRKEETTSVLDNLLWAVCFGLSALGRLLLLLNALFFYLYLSR